MTQEVWNGTGPRVPKAPRHGRGRSAARGPVPAGGKSDVAGPGGWFTGVVHRRSLEGGAVVNSERDGAMDGGVERPVGQTPGSPERPMVKASRAGAHAGAAEGLSLADSASSGATGGSNQR
jgi:hypothetical protein